MPGWRSVKVAAIRTEDLCSAIVPSSSSGGEARGPHDRGAGGSHAVEADASNIVSTTRSGLFQAPYSHEAIMMSTNSCQTDAMRPIESEGVAGFVEQMASDSHVDDDYLTSPDSKSSTSVPYWKRRNVLGVTVPHLLVLMSLAISDILYVIEHRNEDVTRSSADATGASLIVVYCMVGLQIWIIPVKCGPDDLLYILLWVAFYALHAAIAFLSAGLRQDINPDFEEQCGWAACVLALLHFVVQSLYKVDLRVDVLISSALSIAFILVSALCFASSFLEVLEGVVLLVFIILARALSAHFMRREASMEAQELKQLLRPLIYGHHGGRELKTRHERVVKQLTLTMENITATQSNTEVARLMGDAISFLLSELRSPHLLSLIPDKHVVGVSPQTVQFLQHTLGQHNARSEGPGHDDTDSIMTGTVMSGAEGEVEGKPSSDVLSGAGASRPPTPGRIRSGRSFATLSDQQEPGHDTYEQSVNFLLSQFKHGGRLSTRARPPPMLTEEVQEAVNAEVGQWRFDSFKLSQLCEKRPLTVLGSRLVIPYICELDVDRQRVDEFLNALESRYREAMTYHNSTHAADVMNSMLYMLRLKDRQLSATIEPIEKLAALTAAASHDVGHTGQANRFHVTTRSALAMLYNDQSPLENMHCATTFALLRTNSCNFLERMRTPQVAVFRSIVVQMILDTDLSKHIQMVSKFRQEYLSGQIEGTLNASQRRDVLSFMLKCCDVSHSTKPFNLHLAWTLRITCEFFNQGDMEVELGLACSPFCDRQATNIAESQRGFFDFIVNPLYGAMDDYLGNSQFRVEVLHELETNHAFWKTYGGNRFDYEDPLSNLDTLCSTFRRFLRSRANNSPVQLPSPHSPTSPSTDRPSLKSRSGSMQDISRLTRISDSVSNLLQPDVTVSTRSAPISGRLLGRTTVAGTRG